MNLLITYKECVCPIIRWLSYRNSLGTSLSDFWVRVSYAKSPEIKTKSLDKNAELSDSFKKWSVARWVPEWIRRNLCGQKFWHSIVQPEV